MKSAWHHGGCCRERERKAESESGRGEEIVTGCCARSASACGTRDTHTHRMNGPAAVKAGAYTRSHSNRDREGKREKNALAFAMSESERRKVARETRAA